RFRAWPARAGGAAIARQAAKARASRAGIRRRGMGFLPGLETKAPAQEAWPALRSTDCERRRPAGAGTASRSLDGGVVGGRVVGRLVVGARLGGVARGRELAALGALGGRLHAVLAGGLGGLDRRQAGHGGQGGGVGAAVQALHVAGQRA